MWKYEMVSYRLGTSECKITYDHEGLSEFFYIVEIAPASAVPRRFYALSRWAFELLSFSLQPSLASQASYFLNG